MSGRRPIGPQVSASLPLDIIERIDTIAQDHNMSRSETVRYLLAKGLDAYDEQYGR